MNHQPDVQKQPLQEHQRLSQTANIVYIQHPQNYRNQNYSYINEGQGNIIGSQTFTEQNVSFGQFENHYPYVNNGNFPSPNSSTSIISNSFDNNKNKNVPPFIRNTHYIADIDGESESRHQINDPAVQFTSGNFQSVDLQGLAHQQASQFFLQNIGNHYQINDNLVPTYQSSGSSESSDESSVSNASQQHYPSESSGISNNQFEFPLPVPASNQVGQNFHHQIQQKDFLDNYMALSHQEAQVPRCDSSKSETAESTCSSLSSGSTESQSENENVVRLPVLVNPLINNNSNCQILQQYQSNIHNNVPSYSNHVHQSQGNHFVSHKNYAAQSEQSILKYNNFSSSVNESNVENGSITSVNNVLSTNLPPNNQMNNVVVMLPNRLPKNIQNCTTSNRQYLPSPSSQDVLNSSKVVISNQKVNQHKVFGLVNVGNTMLQEKMSTPSINQVNPIVKVNSICSQEGCNENDYNSLSRINENSNCGVYNTTDNGNNGSVTHICSGGDLITHNSPSTCEVAHPCTSHLQNTSDSSVINSNFVQTNFTSKPIKSENSSAMLLKETSDKSISHSVSDVNNSVVDSNSVYLVKNDKKDVIKKKNCYDDSSSGSCYTETVGTNALPVPAGWRRLLVDGCIIYLR